MAGTQSKKRNPEHLGRGGCAVSLYPPLINAGAIEAGLFAYRPRSCGLRQRIAHSWQSHQRGSPCWIGSKMSRTVKAEEAPLIP